MRRILDHIISISYWDSKPTLFVLELLVGSPQQVGPHRLILQIGIKHFEFNRISILIVLPRRLMLLPSDSLERSLKISLATYVQLSILSVIFILQLLNQFCLASGNDVEKELSSIEDR